MTIRKAEAGTRLVNENLSVGGRPDRGERAGGEERWSALDYRLGRIEAGLERLEKRDLAGRLRGGGVPADADGRGGDPWATR
jgi:hypothetical protein